MAWVKKPQGKRKNWAVGYIDQHGRERSKGGFASEPRARKWGTALEEAREDGRLAEFLEERTGKPTDTVHDLVLRWFREDAPTLAEKTFDDYLSSYNAHIRERVGYRSMRDFEHPHNWEELRKQMVADGVGQAAVQKAKTVLSNVYTWARIHPEIPIRDNGMLQTGEGHRRRRRRGRRSERPKPRAPRGKRLEARQAKALSATDFELFRLCLLARVRDDRPPWYPLRDAVIADLGFGLGFRPEEIFGGAWADLNPARARVEEVLSYGTLEAPKTVEHSAPMRPWVWEALVEYRDALDFHGVPCGDGDLVIPGAAVSGVRVPTFSYTALKPDDKPTKGTLYEADRDEALAKLRAKRFTEIELRAIEPTAHLSRSQQHQWRRRNWNEVRKAIATVLPERSYLKMSVPYSTRRGHISGRLYAGESAHSIAQDCGTSERVIAEHYAWAIDDRQGKDPVPFDEQVLEARERGWEVVTNGRGTVKTELLTEIG